MSFEEIYKDWWQKIFRLCMGYINDETAAKDMAQETFLIVWQQLPKFRSEANIGTWIFRIASNLCLRQLERNERLPTAQMKNDLPEIPTESIEGKSAFLYKCIAALPETDRIIISLELEDVKQAEIARIMGISEVSIRVKIHRIKEKLTKQFMHYER